MNNNQQRNTSHDLAIHSSRLDIEKSTASCLKAVSSRLHRPSEEKKNRRGGGVRPQLALYAGFSR